jgi:hypothetical protein
MSDQKRKRLRGLLERASQPTASPALRIDHAWVSQRRGTR